MLKTLSILAVTTAVGLSLAVFSLPAFALADQAEEQSKKKSSILRLAIVAKVMSRQRDDNTGDNDQQPVPGQNAVIELPATTSGGSVSFSSSEEPKVGSALQLAVTPAPGFDIKDIQGCDGYYNGNTYIIPSAPAQCSVTADFAAIGLSYQGTLPDSITAHASFDLDNSPVSYRIRQRPSGFQINWLFEPGTALSDQLPLLTVAFLNQHNQPDQVASFLPALNQTLAHYGYGAAVNEQQQPLLAVSPLSIGFTGYARILTGLSQFTHQDFEKALFHGYAETLLPRAAVASMLLQGQLQLPSAVASIEQLLTNQATYLQFIDEALRPSNPETFEENPAFQLYNEARAEITATQHKLTPINTADVRGEFFSFNANFYEPASNGYFDFAASGLRFSSADSQNIALHLPTQLNGQTLEIVRSDPNVATSERTCNLNIYEETTDHAVIEAFYDTFGTSFRQEICRFGLSAVNTVAKSHDSLLAMLTHYQFRPEIRFHNSAGQSFTLPEKITYTYSSSLLEPLDSTKVGTRTFSFNTLKRWALPGWQEAGNNQSGLLLQLESDGTFQAVADLADNPYYSQLYDANPTAGHWRLDNNARQLTLNFDQQRRIALQWYSADERKNSMLAQYYQNDLLVHKAIVSAGPIDNSLSPSLMVGLAKVLNNSEAKRQEPFGYQNSLFWFTWEYKPDFTGRTYALRCDYQNNGIEVCPSGEYWQSYQFLWEYDNGALSSLRNAESFEDCANQSLCILRSFRLLDIHDDMYTIYEQGVIVRKNNQYPQFSDEPYHVMVWIAPRIRQAKLMELSPSFRAP